MRALRVERNPVRARALLTAYLDRHPKGELSEEALVMLVEAAAAHHDSDAQALVARYHKLYPRGTFRGLVDPAAASKGP
jgi:outer membrane protein assembly factor BamD (BamD/ComL family)